MGRYLGKICKILGLLLIFLANQQNISAFYQDNFKNSLEAEESKTYNNHAASNEEHYANALDSLGIRLYPGSTYTKDDRSTQGSLNHCKALVYQTLMSLPEEHREYLQHLTLYFAEGRRGLGGGSTVILRCSNVDDAELSSVLVHEMGHIVDTGLETGNKWSGKSEFVDGKVPIYNDDTSLRFYRISWENSEKLRSDASQTNFVTGYAMTDPFEDFAETYNFYILHGKQFKEMGKYDKNLRRKYIYMKYFVFEGQEFDFDPYTTIAKEDVGKRNYDSTVMSYDQETFLRSEGRKIATL